MTQMAADKDKNDFGVLPRLAPLVASLSIREVSNGLRSATHSFPVSGCQFDHLQR
jgi:hypothetical protein